MIEYEQLPLSPTGVTLPPAAMSAPADIESWRNVMLIEIHNKLTRLEERLIPLVEKAEQYINMSPMERLRAGLAKK